MRANGRAGGERFIWSMKPTLPWLSASCTGSVVKHTSALASLTSGLFIGLDVWRLARPASAFPSALLLPLSRFYGYLFGSKYFEYAVVTAGSASNDCGAVSARVVRLNDANLERAEFRCHRNTHFG